MLGAEGVIRAVLEYLADVVPDRCVVVAQRLSDELHELVSIDPPAAYLDTDVVDLNAIPKYPVLVGSMATTDVRYVGHELGDDYEFTTDQPMRIHILNRSAKVKDVPDAELGRNRLMLVTAECLLLDPSFGGGPVRMATRQLRSAYHVYERTTPGHIVSPGHHEIEVQAQEQLSAAPLSVPPTTTTVTTQPLT